MIFNQKNSMLIVALFLLQLFSTESAKLASYDQGFTIDLVHRDSPLYNPFAKKYDLIGASIRRSFSRANHFKSIYSSLSGSPEAEALVFPADGAYVTNISIGTPPKPFLGTVDTGSDLIWTQCQPCTSCYRQQIPIFDSRSSKTYEPSSCKAEACRLLGENKIGCTKKNTCLYIYMYGDGSGTMGELAKDTLTFDESISYDGIIFGCGHENSGQFGREESGLIGLGRGPLSLVRQLKSGGSKFTYCLIPYGDQTRSHSSKMRFGRKAMVSGNGVVSTPLVKKHPSTLYYLTLESIIIEKGSSSKSKKIRAPLRFGASNKKGNIIIDSGTTLTFLPSEMYAYLVDALKESIMGEQVQDPQGILQLCYKYDRSLEIPTLIASFAGGANIELSHVNTFISTSDDVVCLAMASGEGDQAIFGNISQQNFLVGYDLDKEIVSFKSTDCKKYV